MLIDKTISLEDPNKEHLRVYAAQSDHKHQPQNEVMDVLLERKTNRTTAVLWDDKTRFFPPSSILAFVLH